MDKLPDHWNKHATQWQWIGSPLRPAAEDIHLMERALLRHWQKESRPPAPRALLLGVTPEIALMRWPSGTRIVAIDHSHAMIRGVWPGARPGSAAVCANWATLPLPDGSQDIVVGDGCFSALLYPGEYQAVVRALRRVMHRHGMFLMRFFTRPEVREPVAAIVDDLMQGRIGNFHVFKWRLAMALHGDLDEGVRLADIWQTWHTAVPEPGQLALRLNWPLRSVLTIDAYRGVETRYTFPTLAEARAAVVEAFVETECLFPGYELGERCPTLIFRPR